MSFTCLGNLFLRTSIAFFFYSSVLFANEAFSPRSFSYADFEGNRVDFDPEIPLVIVSWSNSDCTGESTMRSASWCEGLPIDPPTSPTLEYIELRMRHPTEPNCFSELFSSPNSDEDPAVLCPEYCQSQYSEASGGQCEFDLQGDPPKFSAHCACEGVPEPQEEECGCAAIEIPGVQIIENCPGTSGPGAFCSEHTCTVLHPGNNQPTVESCTQMDSINVPEANEPAICGNGELENGESCDDGNTENGDDCSSNCEVMPISGCTNPQAENYDSMATEDDGSCIIPGCTMGGYDNYDPMANQDDGSCTKMGCMNPQAENYDSMATEDDGSCIIPGCTIEGYENYNPDANQDDGSCRLWGCTDPISPAYNPLATEDDGSCYYLFP